jgi:AcrR family transcriptional regulator
VIQADDGNPPKRQYLRAAARREAILVAADELVASRGLGQLSIVGVAAQAGISRQLIYRHFADLNDLLLALLEFRFAAIEEQFDEAAARHENDPRGLVTSRIRSAMELPARDQHLIRSVFSGIDQLQPEMAGTVAMLRDRMINRWARIGEPSRWNDPIVRASIWALFHAMFGLWDLIHNELLDVESAVDILLHYSSDFSTLRREVRHG